MNILAAIVVQIIGLAVLRDEPQMGGMHAVLPTVAEGSPVESHAAILVFKNTDRIIDHSNQWPSQEFKPSTGYSYVTLKGERIRFLVNGRNVQAKIPQELPHLGKGCARMEQFSQGYQPPAYGSATAVVFLPKGEASACSTLSVNGRIDTRIRLVNRGHFQVAGCNKTITLRDRAVVAVINAPTSWIDGAKSIDESSAPHFDVYFAMAPPPSPIEAAKPCRLRRPDKVKTCGPLESFELPINPNAPGTLHHLIALAPRHGQPDLPDRGGHGVPMATFECSNTQWP